jgi:hypothetical protein
MITPRVRRGRALWRVVDGFVTVASVDGRSVRAGGSAPAIWDELPASDATPIDVAEIVERLAADHDADIDDVESDTMRVLAAWEEIGCAVLEP